MVLCRSEPARTVDAHRAYRTRLTHKLAASSRLLKQRIQSERLSGEPAPWPAEERVACGQNLYAQRQTTCGIPPSRRLAIDFGKFALKSPNIGNEVSAARSHHDFIVLPFDQHPVDRFACQAGHRRNVYLSDSVGKGDAKAAALAPLSKEELDGMHQGASVTDQIKDGIRRL